jgi:hypothetical protein
MERKKIFLIIFLTWAANFSWIKATAVPYGEEGTLSAFTEFKSLKQNPDLYPYVKEEFFKRIQPLYGDQTSALSKVQTGEDRECIILFHEGHPSGILVYKTALTQEFAEFGLKKSLEVKTFFVSTPRKGLGTQLFKYLLKTVTTRQAPFFHLTVSEEKPESLAFFEKRRGQIKHIWYGRYTEENKEYLVGFDMGEIQ